MTAAILGRRLTPVLWGLVWGLFIAGSAALAQDQKPIARVMPGPAYPQEQIQQGIGGAVMVEFVINEEGVVIQAQVTQSSDRVFEKPAVEAVKKWRFKAGQKNGRRVKVRVAQLVEFTIKAKPVYPFELLLEKKNGRATVEFSVDDKGRAGDIRVIEATRAEFGLALQAKVSADAHAPALKKDAARSLRRATQTFIAQGTGDVPVDESARKILDALQRNQTVPDAEELDAPLKAKYKPAARFPRTVGPEITTGSATVEVFVAESGLVQLPRIVTATRPEFGYAAAQAVAGWRFKPPTKNRQATVARTRITMDFQRAAD